MKVVDLKQRTPEWHVWRNAGVTASDAPILMGSPYKTPWRLWGEKRGLLLPEDLSGNPHVRRGIRDEPDARRRFEERHDVMLLPVCAGSGEEPILRASFDGITDEGYPVELKAPTEENLRDAKANGTQSEMYKRHYAQVQAQIFVSGADKGFLSLKWRNDFVDWEVPRDDAFIGQIIEAARAFWECILTAKEPPLDMERDMYVPVGEELEAWLRLAADYRQLDEKLASYVAEAKPKGIGYFQSAVIPNFSAFLFGSAESCPAQAFRHRAAGELILLRAGCVKPGLNYQLTRRKAHFTHRGAYSPAG